MHCYKKSREKNYILERIHKVFGNTLNTNDLANVMVDAVAPRSDIITSITYSLQWLYYTMMQAIPGKLFFGLNILLDINFQPNYKDMWLRKEKKSNYNNKRENVKRV